MLTSIIPTLQMKKPKPKLLNITELPCAGSDFKVPAFNYLNELEYIPFKNHDEVK